MLIVGAGGCARDLLAMLELEPELPELSFYDDVNADAPDLLFDRYEVLKSPAAARAHFRNADDRYVLGVGGSRIRQHLAGRFDALGGRLISLLSSRASIGSHTSISERGAIVMHGVILTQSVSIGEGTLVNMRCTLGHGCTVGSFCDLAPGVFASSVEIGDLCEIGINSVINPGVKIGPRVVVGAGSVVTRDVGGDCTVAGVPARRIDPPAAGG